MKTDLHDTGMSPEISTGGETTVAEPPTTLNKIERAWKTQLKPTKEQHETLLSWSGMCRRVWNWALAESKQIYETEKRRVYGRGELSKQLTKKMKTDELTGDGFPFHVLRQAPSWSIREPLHHLDLAMNAFFRRLKRGENPGYPRFKSWQRTTPSITFRNPKSDGRTVSLEKLGNVKLKERNYLPPEGNTATITYKGGKWWIAVQGSGEAGTLETTDERALCIDTTATTIKMTFDDGEAHDLPALAEYRSEMRRLQIRQRRVSRREKDSNRRREAVLAVQKLHMKIRNRRQEQLHRLSTQCVANASSVVVIRRKNLIENDAMAESDASIGEFLRQLEYKCQWYGRGYEVDVVE